MQLFIVCTASHRLAEARQCAEKCGSVLVDQADARGDYLLVFGDDVRLRNNRKKQGDILVDFCAGAAAHRRKYGGGKGQLIAKAVGVKSGIKPSVYDMTAGLGADSFVLASLGCQVTLLERNPIVHALLADGLARANQFAEQQDEQLQQILRRMHLLSGDSIDWLNASEKQLDVIYLDPMFPERKKSASVKKEMQVFHELVGDDADAESLLDAALRAAPKRVVVKRPRIAPGIDGKEPSYRLEGKSSRYDVYALERLDSR